MGLEYVDIFYSHRPDPDTPLEETMGALDTAVRQGKALYAGISSYSPAAHAEAAAILAARHAAAHPPAAYSMLNRWIEDGLLNTLGEPAWAASSSRRWRRACSPTRYLDGHPGGSRASQNTLLAGHDHGEKSGSARELERHRAGRGQTLAQMALAWTLRDRA